MPRESKSKAPASNESIADVRFPIKPMSTPMGSGEKISVATRRGGRVSATEGKDNSFNSFSNLSSLKNPLKDSGSGVSAKEAISLSQKAYHYVPIFKNTIEISVEFANSPIRFEGGDETSRKFFTEWYKKINSYDLADQFFRELLRSSNLFFYRMDYQFSSEDALESNWPELVGKTIPIRYALLDPCSIEVEGASSFISPKYSKILNKYEIQKLKNPQTKNDLMLYNSLSEKDKKSLKSGRGQISITFDDSKFIAIFGKKQDYEPLAVPFFFPVLSDINLKLEFKKADLAISKTTDYLILLITMGAEPDKGGVDQRMLSAMSSLFENESVGRVIVADYTTKGDFIIPDLNKILGKEKYETVDRDIAQGMMNIFFESDQKFSNSLIKVKLFLERLKEARRIFKDKFLIPEMERIADILGFENIPKPIFDKIDLEDRSQLLRVYTRLAELGFLTPEEFFDVSESGVFPTPENSEESQKEFKKLKSKGLYSPLMSKNAEPSGRPAGTSAPKQTAPPKNANTNTSIKESKRSTAAKFSEIQATYKAIEEIIPMVESEFKKHFSLKRLSQSKKDVAFDFVKSIVTCEPKPNWKKSIKNYIKGESGFINDEILKISEAHSIEYFEAAILFHSGYNIV